MLPASARRCCRRPLAALVTNRSGFDTAGRQRYPGNPGIVAQLTRQIHADAKAAGLPPGSFDSAFAKVHAGSVEACGG